MDKVVKRDLSNVYKEVKDSLFECKIMNENIRNAKYHHNAKFFQGPSIIKSGILSLDEQRKLEGRKITEREKNILSDECYVNGSEYISISSGDIDYEYISEKEFIYNSTLPNFLDILISNDISAMRNSINYANEYLVYKRISPKKIESIDTRILALSNLSTMNEEEKINEIIKNFNYIRLISKEILKRNRKILLREVSDDEINLDVEKLTKMPKLILEK